MFLHSSLHTINSCLTLLAPSKKVSSTNPMDPRSPPSALYYFWNSSQRQRYVQFAEGIVINTAVNGSCVHPSEELAFYF